jgi:hypothetical protein
MGLLERCLRLLLVTSLLISLVAVVAQTVVQ